MQNRLFFKKFKFPFYNFAVNIGSTRHINLCPELTNSMIPPETVRSDYNIRAVVFRELNWIKLAALPPWIQGNKHRAIAAGGLQ